MGQESFKIDVPKINGAVMRGGRRLGAGRKPGEPTVRVRVPEGALPLVLEAVEVYKKTGASIKAVETPVVAEVVKDAPEIIPAVLNDGLEIEKSGRVAWGALEAQNYVLRQVQVDLQKLPNRVLKQIRAEYGTLRDAVRAGVRRQGRGWIVG